MDKIVIWSGQQGGENSIERRVKEVLIKELEIKEELRKIPREALREDLIEIEVAAIGGTMDTVFDRVWQLLHREFIRKLEEEEKLEPKAIEEELKLMKRESDIRFEGLVEEKKMFDQGKIKNKEDLKKLYPDMSEEDLEKSFNLLSKK